MRRDSPAYGRMEELVRKYGSWDYDVIAMLESDDLFTPERVAGPSAGD